MEWIIGALLVVLLLVNLALLLWKERDSLWDAYQRIHGVPPTERVRLTDADRRAEALAAKEQENFLSYDGTEQPEIDASQFIGYE